MEPSKWLDGLGEEGPPIASPLPWRPLGAEEIERVMQLPKDFGFQIGDVDEVLYGKLRRPK